MGANLRSSMSRPRLDIDVEMRSGNHGGGCAAVLYWQLTSGELPELLTGDSAVKATVVGLQGDLAGKRFAIGEAPVTFGRGESDIVIADRSVSRLHAEIRQEDDGYVIADRGSSNGTWVNGDAITTHRLQSGDEILIAGQRFKFEVSGGAE